MKAVDYENSCGLSKIIRNVMEDTKKILQKSSKQNIPIIISGGGSFSPHIRERVEEEFRNVIPETVSINVKSLPEFKRSTASWIGGSALASMEMFGELSLSKKEYLEQGFPYSIDKFSW